MSDKHKGWLPLIAALVLAAALKAWLWGVQAVPFNGDEAVVALMARHITQGARPIFFYGQAYMGSLDAFLVAGGFGLLGEGVAAVRVVQALLYLVYLVAVWWLARRLFEDQWVANFAVLAAALPTVLVSTYTSATLGGYNESIIFGVLIIGLGHAVIYGELTDRGGVWLILGLVGGLAFWTLGIAGVYLLPVALLGLWHLRFKPWRGYLLAAIGFFVGSAPWWLYNLTHNWAALWVLRGPANITYSGTLLERTITLLFLAIPGLLGFRGPWMAGYFPIALLLPGLFLAGMLAISFWRLKDDGKHKPHTWTMMIAMVITILSLWLLTSFGIDISGRYLLPLHLPLVLVTGVVLASLWKIRRSFAVLVLAGLWLFNLAGTLVSANSPDRITTQFDPITRFDNRSDEELIEFLTEAEEFAGYTNYWVAFRLAFLTGEQLHYAPELPDKADLSYTTAYNRYLPINLAADSSNSTAYITTQHPILDAVLREKLNQHGITYLEADIGPYHIFYHLSHPVRPEELGFSDGIIR